MATFYKAMLLKWLTAMDVAEVLGYIALDHGVEGTRASLILRTLCATVYSLTGRVRWTVVIVS